MIIMTGITTTTTTIINVIIIHKATMNKPVYTWHMGCKRHTRVIAVRYAKIAKSTTNTAAQPARNERRLIVVLEVTVMIRNRIRVVGELGLGLGLGLELELESSTST